MVSNNSEKRSGENLFVTKVGEKHIQKPVQKMLNKPLSIIENIAKQSTVLLQVFAPKHCLYIFSIEQQDHAAHGIAQDITHQTKGIAGDPSRRDPLISAMEAL